MVPYPSTLQAVLEYRWQALLDEAAQERLAIAAARSRPPAAGARGGAGHGEMPDPGESAAAPSDSNGGGRHPAPSRRARIVYWLCQP